MKTAQKTIAANSVAPDASRPLTAALPLRVIAGRGLVDADGRVILNAHAGRVVDMVTGDVRDGAGLSPCEADANAHAIAHALNIANETARGPFHATPAAADTASERIAAAFPGDGKDATYRDALQSFALALQAEHVSAHAIDSALTTVFDAVANNDADEIDRGPLDALRANMAHAAWNRETCTIGGGDFSPTEMRAIVAALDAIIGSPL